MIVPWKIPPARRIAVILCAVLGLVMAIIGIYCLVKGDLLNGGITLLMGGFFVISLAGRQLKMYQRAIGVLGAVVLLILAIAIAFTVQNVYLRGLILLLALAWSFFVVLGIYNVFIKKQHPKAPE